MSRPLAHLEMLPVNASLWLSLPLLPKPTATRLLLGTATTRHGTVAHEPRIFGATDGARTHTISSSSVEVPKTGSSQHVLNVDREDAALTEKMLPKKMWPLEVDLPTLWT